MPYLRVVTWNPGTEDGGAMAIDGDLNATAGEFGHIGILPAFAGTSDNLSHILAESPHHILTAGVQW